MTFEEFKVLIEKELSEALANEEIKVFVKEVPKTNGIKHYGLSFKDKEGIVCPVIYLESFFNRFTSGRTIGEIVAEIKNLYYEFRVTEPVDFNYIYDFDKVKDHIYIKVLNAEKNTDIMNRAPFLTLEDLIAVFYIKVRNKAIGEGSILVINEFLEYWNTDISHVAIAAIKNEKESEYELSPVADIVTEIIKMSDDYPEDVKEEFIAKVERSREMNLFVLTNKDRFYGASKIFDPEVMMEVKEKLQGDFYIVPSSIHELILLPASAKNEYFDSERLNELVNEVNTYELNPGDVLSNHIYYFDGDMKKVVSVV